MDNMVFIFLAQGQRYSALFECKQKNLKIYCKCLNWNFFPPCASLSIVQEFDPLESDSVVFCEVKQLKPYFTATFRSIH